MAKTKTLYLANDNTEFDTEQAADAHNVTLAKGSHIEAYIVDAGLEKAQAGLMRKHIAQYLAFADANPDASAETPAQKAAAAKAAAKEEAGEEATA